MFDRAARDELAAAVEDFLDERSTARQFDKRIGGIARRTADITVQKMVGQLWLFYDDWTDHKVCLQKPRWDMLQRLLLALRSDAEWRERPDRWVWTWTHTVAAAALAGFGAVALWTGLGVHLWFVAVPFGLEPLPPLDILLFNLYPEHVSAALFTPQALRLSTATHLRIAPKNT